MIINVHKKDFLPHLSSAVDIDLHEGNILLIKGENGVGKSTLAKEIFRLHSDHSVLIRQEELDLFYDRNLKQIKRIFTSSAGQKLNVELFQKYWMEFGLDKKEDRVQSRLSGGESQMLKLCLGAFLKKDLIIFDEPSQNLDSGMQSVLNKMIGELCSMKKMILIIEHETAWLNQKTELLKLMIKDHKLTGERA